MPMREQRQQILVSTRIGAVDTITLWPDKPRAAMLLAHGAGAPMQHPFMDGIATALAAAQIVTVRYQFPYTQANRKRPDPPAVLRATVEAVDAGMTPMVSSLPLFWSGKSMGGRISAEVLAQSARHSHVRGVIFFGFPLHAPGRPDSRRAEKLVPITRPMLFLQGAKDRLAELSRMQTVCRNLGQRARWVVIDDADHGFVTPKRRHLSPQQMSVLLTEHVVHWMREACGVSFSE